MSKKEIFVVIICIVLFIAWMYIVNTYIVVSWDELTIEEQIRYEQFIY